MSKIYLRAVTTPVEVEHFQQLERLIWQSPAEDVVPVHVAVTVIRNGGGLIAAFAEEGPPATGGMVGLTFWFPGLGVPTTSAPTGRQVTQRAKSHARQEDAPHPLALLKMCSHMAGVLPAWRGHGLGAQLKLAQREAVLAQGMTNWVTWTYDPLFRTNAVLNIRRLGALCNVYRRDWYGVMKDGLNAGVPSDRCQVDWWLDSERVEERVTEGEGRRNSRNSAPAHLFVVPTSASASGFRSPTDGEPPLNGRPLALPIPDDIAAIRRSDTALGMAWRLFMRHHLEQAFAAGYVISDCLNLAGEWHYLLEMNPDGRAIP